MDWQYIVAIFVAIPFIIIPAGLVWYLNVSGIYQVLKDKLQRDRRYAIRKANKRAI